MSIASLEGHKWTYKDYANLPEDGQRHEIINGMHYMNTSSSVQHQHVSKRLQYQLYTKIELAGLGVLYDAPIDVHLSDHDVVQPDLVIILNKNIRKITPTKIKVAPELVVEILSPSTASNDQTIKKDLYERSGVAEYWIVDPFEQHVDQWVLVEWKYVLLPKSNVLELSFASNIRIDVETIW